eukprot:SM000086S23089  [mRNA]  locus=s86:477104:482501:- [translate_table: standard]
MRVRDQLARDPDDAEAWHALAAEAQARPARDAAPLYELLLARFPTSGKYWKAYAEAQMAAGDDAAVKAIFGRCLLTCLHADLWKCYVRYIRKSNSAATVEGRDAIQKAYDFTLSRIGLDVAAGSLWSDYITFLKSLTDEGPKLIAVRQAYQRAVALPMQGVEQLWREYEAWENGLNRALAKALLAEHQPIHMNARAVYRERKKLTDRIDQQALLWRQIVAFERSNPLRLDKAAHSQRVTFTYEQALLYLRCHPDVWFDYANWQAQLSLSDRAADVYQAAIKALPACLSRTLTGSHSGAEGRADSAPLYYAYAEFQEARACIKEARGIYDALIQNPQTCSSVSFIMMMRFARRAEGVEPARKVFAAARKSPACTYHVYTAAANLELCMSKDAKAGNIACCLLGNGSVVIAELVAVAKNIFELGLKKYIGEAAYVLQYAEFLERINDEPNVRALFERALSVLPPSNSTEVWDELLAFEHRYGDLASILKAEERRQTALMKANDEDYDGDGDDLQGNKLPSLQLLVARYRYLDLWPCSAALLDHLGRMQLAERKPAQRPAASPDTGSVLGASGLPPTASAGDGRGMPTIVKPDVSKMVLYDPNLGLGDPLAPAAPLRPAGQQVLKEAKSAVGLTLAKGTGTGTLLNISPNQEGLRQLPPNVAAFLSQLPPVPGPYPDVDMVMRLLLQADLSALLAAEASVAASHAVAGGPANLPATHPAAPAGSNRPSKRKEVDEPENLGAVASKPPLRDVFRMRQLQRVRGSPMGGSSSGGGGSLSGEPSGSSS